MTAGQEGGHRGPSGEPLGGGSGGGGYGPAPQPPGFVPAPPPPPAQGWPPMAPPYPGYGPAPSAPPGQGWVAPPGPGQLAPPRLERPTTVRAGLGAIIAGLILSLVGIVYQFANFDEVLNASFAAAEASTPGTDIATTRDLAHTIVVGVLVFGIVWLCLEVLFVWFAWQGRNWARVVLWVVAGLGVVGGLFSFSSSSYLPGFLRTLSVCEWLLVAAAIVLLALKPSNEWYRYRRWLRDTGQPG